MNEATTTTAPAGSEAPPMTTTDKAGQERPLPAPAAPPRQALREVYEKLLAIEQARLEVAVRIEAERGIVFPETSVIVRDVRTLAERLYGPEDAPGRPGPPAALVSPPAAAGGASVVELRPGPVDEVGDLADLADEVNDATDEALAFLQELEGQAMGANDRAARAPGVRRGAGR